MVSYPPLKPLHCAMVFLASTVEVTAYLQHTYILYVARIVRIMCAVQKGVPK